MRFQFDIPIEAFFKSARDGEERRIGGVCTTEEIDSQNEVILQDGLDFGPFLKSGWFNDNHDPSTDGILGYPTKAELRTLPTGRKGWYVEGYLLKGDGSTRADRIWELANALQKTDRRLGFSVEGKILDRDPEDPTKVRKAAVSEVAITKCPVNTGTQLAVLAKSLSAGNAVSDPGAAPGEGFPLRAESLEGGSDEDEEKKKKKKKKRRLTKSEAVTFLMHLHPKMTREAAEEITNYALRHYM